MAKPAAQSKGIEILCGPSGSGKTGGAVKCYARQVCDRGEDSALLILPTARVVREVRARLVEDGLVPGLVDPRIFTFPQLAEIILNANHECATALDQTQQNLLLREVTQHLLDVGQLTELAEVSVLPGFVAALADLIGELKRAAIEPKAFCGAMQEAGLSELRHQEVGRLYCAYQWLLVCLRYFDEAGLFWWARGVLGRGERRPLTRVELMVVDGFTDFTTTQLEMLELLAGAIPRTLITLDHVADDPRGGVGAWLRDTLDRLQKQWPEAAMTALRAETGEGPLAHLRTNLFRRRSGMPGAGGATASGSRKAGEARSTDAGGKVHILTCPGHSREVREVLRRVKELVVTGRAGPGDIAIICRSLGERAPTVRELAARMGVPVHIESPRSPASSRAVQTVLHAYETVAQGYRRADVLALLRSQYLCWQPLAEEKAVTAEDVAAVTAAAKIVDGREQWMERLAAHRRRVERREAAKSAATSVNHEAEGDPRPSKVELARAVEEIVPHLFDLLPDAAPDLSLVERVQETRAFIERTGLWQSVARPDMPEHASWDIRAVELLDEALDELEHARPASLPADGLSAGAYHALLCEVLESKAEAPPPPAGDRVTVTDARRARQLRFRFCFVMGLTEGEFPQRPAEQAFFTPPELADLAKRDIVLQRRRTPEADEPVLFYGAVCTATEELWLSYPGTDTEGQSLQVSHYVQEVERCFGPGTIDRVAIGPSQVLPDAHDVADDGELLGRAFLDLAEPAGERSPLAYNALRRRPSGEEIIRQVAEAVSIEQVRLSPEPGGAYAGQLTDGLLVGELQQRFGAEHRFSGTELNDYVGCPFAFFCGRVLYLAETVVPVAGVERLDVGRVYHRILSAFTRSRLKRAPGAALVAPGGEEEAAEELRGLADREFARFADEEGVAEPALWDIERLRCHADMEAWVRQEVDCFDEQVPLGCEVVFGRIAGRPVRLPGHDDVLVQGRIDRVNRDQAEGQDRYVLIDYKTGEVPSAKAVERGEDLQFPLYTIGAAHGLGELAAMPCGAWRYFRVARPPAVKKAGDAGKIEEVVAALVPVIADHAAAIRGGAFSYEQVDQCARHCEFADVCRREIRPKTKRSPEAGNDESA